MKKILIILMILLFSLCSACTKYITYTPYMTGNCVDRVVAIRQELKKEGYQTKLILGIIKVGKKESAHAWVMYKLKVSDKWKRIGNY